MPPKKQNTPQQQNLTPSEIKVKAKDFFNNLLEKGNSPWPNKFLTSKGFTRQKCSKCSKNFWARNTTLGICGDSSCAGVYSFIHPETPPETKTTYLQAWLSFKQSLENAKTPHTAILRYPVVARWRADVDFVAAGIYCFQPFCVNGESDPPANPLCAAQFSLRFNDLDNIGITGRHFSGFNMLGIQVFNHFKKEQANDFDEYEEIYWKDSCIEENFNWAIDVLHLDIDRISFIEDVWQGGGTCGACVEYFYGGLEIGNMVFMEYLITPDTQFVPLKTKVIDVGIGLERIPWLCNGSWTSYIDVFDYLLPKLSSTVNVDIENPLFHKFAKYTARFDVDENKEIEQSWKDIGNEMGINDEELATLKDKIREFSDLVVICDHTRTVLFAIEDGALPSGVGGGGNIRNVLRRVFGIFTEEKLA